MKYDMFSFCFSEKKSVYFVNPTGLPNHTQKILLKTDLNMIPDLYSKL